MQVEPHVVIEFAVVDTATRASRTAVMAELRDETNQ